MARISFKEHAKRNLLVKSQQALEVKPKELTQVSAQLRSVLGLYDLGIEAVSRIIACLLDGREEAIEPYRRQCRKILVTLDAGLNLEEELAMNLHILYGHCLRRLGEDGRKLSVEDLDCARNVIARLRHVYYLLAQKKGLTESVTDTGDD